jgi:hypothetical protein
VRPRCRLDLGAPDDDGRLADGWEATGRKESLLADIEQFKRQAPVAAPAEETMLDKTISTLGTILTFNFFVIISFFLWFLTGVGAQFGAQNTAIIDAFRGAWDWLIQPLLGTHMTLTFLSAGLERISGKDEAA